MLSCARSLEQTAPKAVLQYPSRTPETLPDRSSADAADTPMTPMMAQYWAIKNAYPDCLLFYRMGDFYELFFDDAVQAAQALDIALTKRGKHLGDDIAMCGVPVHSHEAYLARLIRKGFRVAVCEQTEDPAAAKKRGAKSVVSRDVVRLVTPGTLTEETLLDARRHNYLVACAEAEGRLGLAWLDISTGDFFVQSPERSTLAAALSRLEPNEVIIAETLRGSEDLRAALDPWQASMHPLPASRFDSINGRRQLEGVYGMRALDAFGQFSRAEIAAAGALVDYVALTQKGHLPRLRPLRPVAEGSVMEIDTATRRNLELARTTSGDRRGSLLATIDRTLTGGGARLLAARLAAPLMDSNAINLRLDQVQFCIETSVIREAVRERLRRFPDMERALSRLGLGRGGPRDLAAVRDGMEVAGELAGLFREQDVRAPEMANIVDGLGDHRALTGHLRSALAADLPPSTSDGGFIVAGYSASLDEQRALRDDSRRLVAELQAAYAAETGIGTLKIRHNNVLGYFVEVSAKHAEKVPAGPGEPFIHRQTMASAVRYTTVALGDLENRISRAADQALALEMELFADLLAKVLEAADGLCDAAAAVAELDVSSALAVLAIDGRYCRPRVDDSHAFVVRGGRHPVVEAALRRSDEGSFVPNDCDLTAGGRLWLLTGPNMAGKSTFLRQNALIAILAQMGSFVPAEDAHIGLIDRLFSRVGAADDLARGRSTFMVEMVETAAIVHQASPRSLVILDEIGRGTATYDGLSIAWAVIEQLHDVNRCRALFATHYHELTHLAGALADLVCYTMRVKEWKGDVVFLHEVAAGAADRSYGIHVARLAGLPEAVVGKASRILEALERGDPSSPVSRLADDLPLFAAAPVAARPPSQVEQALREVHPDGLTPRQALDLVYRLRELV